LSVSVRAWSSDDNETDDEISELRNMSLLELLNVTVIGSRIARLDKYLSSPVISIRREQIEEFGAITVEEVLNTLPQFIDGQTAATNAIGGGGGATLNLRAMGSVRNLVLLDQRRLPMATPFGEVDVNILPTVLLKEIEILTGGASSVYGSEAISGVVNFHSRSHFNGVEVNYQQGSSIDSGFDKTDLSILAGTEGKDGRIKMLFALGQTDRSGLSGFDRLDSYRFAGPSSFIAQGTFRAGNNAPSQTTIDALFQGYGVTESPQLDRIGFNDDGSLFTQFGGGLNYRGPTNTDNPLFWLRPNGDGIDEVRMAVWKTGVQLKPLDRNNAFAKVSFDINDSLTTYFQFLYADTTTRGSVGHNVTAFGPQIMVPVTHPDIPTDLASLLASRPDPNAPFIMEQRYLGLRERYFDENFSTSQYLLGAKGDLVFRDWQFDIYASRDAVTGIETNESTTMASRINQLLQATDGGESLCEGGFNPFGLTNSSIISAECQQFMSPDSVSKLTTDRKLFEASITGPLINLPAGDAQLSLTASYREDKLKFTPSFALEQGDILGRPASSPTTGSTTTIELGGELLIPVVKDAPLAKSLNIATGFRRSDQNVAGAFNSWHFGLEWQIAKTLFARGNVQRALRAPNMGELFAGDVGGEIQVGTPPAKGDPCDIGGDFRSGQNAADIRAICIAQGIDISQVDSFTHSTNAMPISIVGNNELKAETANTYTLGFVWTPEIGIRDATIIVDFWSIEVENVINFTSGNQVLERCVNRVFNPSLDPNNAQCRLIERESETGLVSNIETKYQNLSALETSGIDIQVSGTHDLGPGQLHHELSVGWLNAYKDKQLAGEAFLDFTGTIDGPANRAADNNFHPEWKFQYALRYEIGAANISLRWRYTSAMDDRDKVFNSEDTTPGVPSISYFDLFGTYQILDSLKLQFGVSNLFDQEAPLVNNTIGITRPGMYDVIRLTYQFGFSMTL